jgi:hypothetical protein
MKEDLTKLETAKLAKEKGFDLIVRYFYSDYSENKYIIEERKDKNYNIQKRMTSAPTQSLLQKWLREEHKIEIKTAEEGRGYRSWYKKKDGKRWVHALGGYTHKPTYEEALEKGLQEALKLIKSK